MTKTNKISSLNLFSVLFLNHLFAFVCYNGKFSLISLPAIFSAWLFNAFLMFFVVYLYKKGFNFRKALKESKFFSIFLFFIAIFIISVSFIQIKAVSNEISIPFDSTLIMLAIIIAICSYTSSLGIKTMAKSSIIIFIMFIIGIIIIFLGSFDKIQLSSVYLAEDSTFFSQFISFLPYTSEPFILFVFMPYFNKITYKSLSLYSVLLLIFDILLCLLCITVIHQKMIFTNFPFITLSTLSQPFSIQRSDTLYIIIFVLLFVFRISSLAYLGGKILDVSFKKIPFKVIFTLLSASLMSCFLSLL